MFLGPEIASYLMANVIFLYTESSAAATMRGLAELFVTVLSLDLALFGLGFLIGLRVSPFDCPARVNNIPRLVPRQPFFLSPLCTSAIAGVVIFASIYVEVYFILQALWTNLSYYYLFGLLLIVVLAMLVVSAEVAIFAVYLLLCYENHRWWWAAFRIPASVSFVFFAYCIFFMVTVYRPPDRESVAVFLIFSFVIALGLAFANGAVGFLCAFTVVQRMYGALKME
jgi:transmembrane 9 superfamily protein 2/4